jgi:hypothetical protein
MTVEYLGTGDDDGTVLGRDATADKVGFYGATPVVRPAATAQSAVATAAITTVETYTTTVWAASINSLIERVSALTTLANQIRSDQVTLGLIKGSA